MGITQTHTYVTLEVTETTYREIAQKLREAGYHHAFNAEGEIDMHGLALVAPCACVGRAGLSDGACEDCMNTGRCHG